MDPRNVEFKYSMNLWKTLPGYPTSRDVIYEISSYLVKDGRPNGEFTEQTFNSIFGKDWESTEVGYVVKKMMSSGDLEKSERNTSGKDWYKIKENPYYK